MQISMRVPYDEKQLRRTLRFILRPQLKFVRIMSGVLIVLSLALVALKPSSLSAYGFLVLGLLFVVAMAPIAVARSMRQQSDVFKDGFHMTLDTEWLTVIYPLAELRFRWTGIDRVIETPEVWYIMIGKLQAITVPKSLMTEEQRAEFAAFVKGLQPAGK